MDDLIIYTCITNGKDTLKEYEPEKGVRYICFTDGSVSSKTGQWEVLPICKDLVCPVKTARFHKIMAHNVLPDHKWSVWIDGHLTPKVRQSEVVDWMNNNVFGCMMHQDRNCIYDEMSEVLDLKIEDEYVIKDVFNRYKKESVPTNYGLHRTGVLVRKNVPIVQKFNELWWNEVFKNSKRDQLSFDYIRWKLNFVVTELNISWYKQDTHKNNERTN